MKSYLINLASRPDRLAQATDELTRVGIEFERFEAFTPDQAGGNRPLAFNKSQYYCIKKAVDEGHERFAVFEDDVAFTEGAREKIDNALLELPDCFGLMHMGCNIVGMSTTEWKMPDKSDSHIAELFNCWQTHAIVWNKWFAKVFLKRFPFYTDDYAKEGLMIFDEWLRQNMYDISECYVMRPMVAYQRPDFSDLNQAQSDYTSCFELGNKYLRAI
jgi:GR25 family glycosyltransferase involved in LPS biosynthesis